ncbi:WD40 repeat-like protein [Punctularia strigosozonata HHB-11173 SS5]|uniref:WD40 repeat-like protein n=1 Tax=Punctularia strigosozonata (strain HHB-11173) TaxID=741275 RepID=UPI000441691B|nr:WD40 repeat-like protein [Punctularia strigosozonata HHB-11173 SS5]EIN10211.1 WD40 repeat-like protein [Punctularia strigosozonata HHB-11173 SS5]
MQALRPSPTLHYSTRPLATAALPSEAYVLALARTSTHYAAAASAPSDAIHLFDRTSLRGVGTFPGHPGGLTALKSLENLGGSTAPLLASAGRDGVVRTWDARTGFQKPLLEMSVPPTGKRRAVLSFDVSTDGALLAMGSDIPAPGDDALLLFFDPRAPGAPLRTHASTHSDDVTAVHFLPPHLRAAHAGSGSRYEGVARVVLSAGSDGLVCTSDAEQADEDEAGVAVGNWGCSVARCGWVPVRSTFGAGARVWAASDMETFSIWTDELDQLYNADIREPSLHEAGRTWVTDYLIGCYTPSLPTSDPLQVFVGSNEGDFALLSPSSPSQDPSSSSSGSNTPFSWTLQGLFTNAHAGVVRSVLYDDQNNVVISGGEDGKLNAWSCPPGLFSSASPEEASVLDHLAPSRNDDAGAEMDTSMDVDMDMADVAAPISAPRMVSSPSSGRKREYEDPTDGMSKKARR